MEHKGVVSCYIISISIPLLMGDQWDPRVLGRHSCDF